MKKSVEKINSKNKMTKKSIVLTSILGVFFAICGSALGAYLAIIFSPKSNQYDGLDFHSYLDDSEKIYQKYLSDQRDPLTYSPSDLANIAIYQYSLEDYTYSEVDCSSIAVGITQITRSKTIKNIDSYYNESISSSSFKKIAKRFYENNDQIDYYDGNLNEDSNGYFGTYLDYTTLSENDYLTKWGKTINNPISYIISSKTVLDDSTIKKTADGYQIYLNLHPIYSTLLYAKQMSMMSGLNDAPEFDYVHITLNIDQNLNLTNSQTKEAYNVFVFGKNYTESSMEETFHIEDKEIKIPNIDEKVYF